jgi:hypothetical protein
VNFAFFEALTIDEAQEYLTFFRRNGAEGLRHLMSAGLPENVTVDFSVESVPGLLAFTADSATTLPLDPDPTLPEWLLESDSYRDNLFEFSDQSKILLAAAAYYLGEAFVRTYPVLRWSVGSRNTAPQGQPVVTGFEHEMEMPVLLVAENLVARSLTDDGPPTDSAQAMASWERKIPKS